MESDILRKRFLDFFKSKDHKLLPSDSLVPTNDPTVLFTSAGMNQFKKQFLGYDIPYPRVTTCQKCLRTDDLEKVGKTYGHHTFFEMLGNFSFGDYFKEEAIRWAWEFLTDELGLSEKKLWVSVYNDDTEAYKIWEDIIKFPRDKIIKLGDKENFWPAEAKQKGPNGPCGPCSEIFFDQGKGVGCRKPDCEPSCNCNRYVEVWNLVFTQFERTKAGALIDLPHKNIDTGMGLERLAAVMQGVLSNFDTDLFAPIIKTIEEISGVRLGDHPSVGEAFYAISDHIRAITFAISDGIIPSNEERGYVIRNLIRRSLQHGRNLEIKKAFLYKLVPIVCLVMQKAYPQLNDKREDIALITKAEEERFLETLDQRLPKLRAILKELADKGDSQVPADLVFRFRDTYGMPWDIIETTAASFSLGIDWPEVEGLLEGQRRLSRNQSSISEAIFVGERKFKEQGKFERDSCELDTEVVDLFKDSPESRKVEVVLGKTPFYPESGGQIGDSGILTNKNTKIEVYDTKKVNNSIVHYGKIIEGEINIGDRVLACIDRKRRRDIAKNHTATHLLQAALRKVLGEHVHQQGSLVSQDRLRFDFTHFRALTKQELGRVEEVVNSFIRNNDPTKNEEMPLDEARQSGALAFFGDKYTDRVNVVSIGNYSKEFCGGTHLENTGKIGLFKIISESSVSSGVRRIEATTGDFAYDKLKEENHAILEVSSMLGVEQDRVEERIKDLQSNLKQIEKRLNSTQMKLLTSSLDKIMKDTEVIDGKNVVSKFILDYDVDSLRKMVDLIKEQSPSSIILLSTLINNKVFLAMGITDDLVKKGLDAAKILKQISSLIGARGAGRIDFAQAGGGDPSKIKEIDRDLKKIIKGGQ